MKTRGRKGDASPAVELTWSQVLALRVQRHHLHRRSPRAAMLDVVRDICGLHAQLMSSAELTLWARVDDLEPDAVDRALWEDRVLVKAWAMRGTLHVLPSADYPCWQAAINTYQDYPVSAWLKFFGEPKETVEGWLDATAAALVGRVLTREELADEVLRLTGSAAYRAKMLEGWGSMLKPVTYRGYLCFGPNLGQNVRFTRTDTWIPGWRRRDPDESLREITRWYLRGYGPANREDYGRWSGMPAPKAGRLIEALGAEVTPVEVEGAKAWILTEQLEAIAGAAAGPSVRLLPAFDPFVLGVPRQASGFFADAVKDRIFRQQGWISPVLVVDGRIEGTWQHERNGGDLSVRVQPFTSQPTWVREAAASEAERLARFFAAPLRFSWD